MVAALDSLVTEIQLLLDDAGLAAGLEFDLLQAAAEVTAAGGLVDADLVEAGSLDRVRAAAAALPPELWSDPRIIRAAELIVSATTRTQ